MPTENVFKFVALRGPGREETHASIAIPFGDDDSFADAIRRRVSTGRPVARAREDVAREFMSSPRYVMRASEWRDLLRLRSAIAGRIADARRLAVGDGVRSLRRDLQNLMVSSFGPGFRIADFAGSDEWQRMWLDLWHSLFSNVALQSRRPEDREDLVFWIRVFELMRVIEDDDRLSTLIAAFDSLRPAVPYAIFRPADEVGDEAEGGSDSQSDPAVGQDTKLADAKLAIKELRDARAAVKSVLYAKAERFSAARSTVRIARGVRTIDDDALEPWIITSSDLDGYTLDTLRRHGIAVEGQAGARIDAAIAARIPTLFARMHGLSVVRKVAYVGRAPVMRRKWTA